MPYFPKIKICGITNLPDARFALEQGADALGFVFYGQSKRFVEPETAKKIISELGNAGIKNTRQFLDIKKNFITVGVFANEDPEKIRNIINDLNIDIIQLSGDESLEYICESKFNKNSVLKAVNVRDEADINKIYRYKDAGIKVLIETITSQGVFGGTGIPVNLDILKNIDVSGLILAGGIGAENIGHIVKSFNPYGIDLSSKLEDSPGKKDNYKIALFFKNLRGALDDDAR